MNIKNKIKNFFAYLSLSNSNSSLKGTWHVCNHDWEIKEVSEDGPEGWVCAKCGVQSVWVWGSRVILVNSENNAPHIISPWGLNQKPCYGITNDNYKNHDQ